MSAEALSAAITAAGGPAGEAGQRALRALDTHGLPGRSVERWRYTRSARFADFATTAMSATVDPTDTAALVHAWRERTGATSVAVFVGGRFDDALSDLPEGLRVRALDVVPPVGSTDDPADALVWLNTARPDGCYQIETAGAEAATLHCLHLPAASGTLAQTRLHLALPERASLTWIDHLESGFSDAHMLSLVTTCTLAHGATLAHTRLQDCHDEALVFTRLDAQLGRDARFGALTLDTGAELVRNELNVQLTHPGAATDVRGIYLTDHTRHVDNHTHIDHAARDTASREDYRGILRGRSRAVFNGKVMVRPGADGTDAAQSNANLLLSDHAEVDTKPELEIYADDVKCSHGATVGQFDADALFYLRARGIDAATATQLLSYAFCRELLDATGPQLRRLAEARIASQIPDFSALEMDL